MEDFSITKIEPHFYYNALEYINSVAIINNIPEISNVVLALGKMMRYWTDDNNEWISINNELEYINEYLIITRIRYDEYFNFYIKSEDIIDEKCPRYILEPILNDIVLNIIGNDVKGIEIIISVKYTSFEIIVKDVNLNELRCKDKIANKFIYGENRLKKLTNNTIKVNYENNNTIVTYIV